MTYMWAGNRKAMEHKGRPHIWHLTPTVLPAEREPGRIPTLCGHNVSDRHARRETAPGPACSKCVALSR